MIDIPDLIAGTLGVSRATAYDLMRAALAEAQPQQEPAAGLLVGQDSDGRYVSIAAKAHADTLPLGEYKLYTSPLVTEFVCSTGLCHYRKPLTKDQ